jgi:Mn2+/Fe2+ NRAMP family transporter
MQAEGSVPLARDPALAHGELRRICWDTRSGMFYSDLTAYCIILATAVTLNVAGVTDINTAAQAASALRPMRGRFAVSSP